MGTNSENVVLYQLINQANEKQTADITDKFNGIINILKNELNRITQENLLLKKKCLVLERKVRRNNVVIFGLPPVENNSDLLKGTVQKLNDLLDTSIHERDINNIYKIGKSDKPPVIVEFISYLRKKSLFENIDKVKNLKEHGIAISNDLCPEDRENNKILVDFLKEAKAEGHNAKLKGGILYVEDQTYTIEDLKHHKVHISKENNTDTEIEEKLHNSQHTNKRNTAANITPKNFNIQVRPLVEKKLDESKNIKQSVIFNSRTTRSNRKK